MTKTKPNYAATLTYGKTKYVHKDMYMTDNENNKILEDQITTKLWDDEKTKELKMVHDRYERRLKQMRECNAPEMIINSNIFSRDLEKLRIIHKEEIEEEAKKYCEENPVKEEYVNLIYERFDMWFETYKNDEDMLDDELGTGHNFLEPWYWGETAIGADERFYEHILTQEDEHYQNYFPVFEACNNKIRKRLIELDKAA